MGHPGIAVELDLDENSGVLKARVLEADAAEPLSHAALEQMIEDGGYADFSFQPNALNAVLSHARKQELGEYVIARRLDAEISVSPTVDKLQALLTTTRAYGGAGVTVERVHRALAEAKILAETIVSKAVRQAVAQDAVTNLVIAEGVSPKAGTDSRTEVLVDLEKEISRPRQFEDGRVDHYSVRDFVIVEAGTRLLRRYPPTRGQPGRDVFGKVIAARDGKDVPLPKEMPGVLPDPEEETVFVAEYKGHPVVIPGGIRVDKTLLMEYVDLRTGNIDFDGSVLVRGDVAAGVVVRATGDITVNGTVENANLDAGGDLSVRYGVTGSEAAINGGRQDVLIRAVGSIRAGFASGVQLRAGRDIVVKEYLNHCDSVAQGLVLVGQTGGRGLVVGGTCHGCQGVQARVAGTAANVKTYVGVGVNGELQRCHQEALQERQDLDARLRQLKSMLASIEQREERDGDDKLVSKVQRTIEEFERRTVEVDVRLEEIAAEVDASKQASATCNQHVHPGVVVEIGSAVMAVRTEGSGGRFVLKDGEISWE